MKNRIQTIRRKIHDAGSKAVSVLRNNKGELATNTIGGIIVGVVIVGLLIIAINKFFPGFFSDMFGKMSDKLNGNW
ncbi:hypothetical protein KL86CLO1_11427 [uncultured Eubacteriales bacterium]|uniref:Uncharacterized protein n=1 Tax=uncultured Eubacteriales bacterium TaxID=172733 RepID=A0A212JNU7_9FIRM|nr:hypothetical protein KL86CLO1_11427 [uncultured Eubacteriales bacterium]